MQMFRSRIKKFLLKLAVSVLSTSQMSRLLNRFVNNFQLKRDEQNTLSFPFIKKRRSGSVQILIYHRVNDQKDQFFPATPTNVFSRQMEYLAHNFNICSLENAIDMMRNKDIPDNAVVVTFDDGYKDNYTTAFPILKSYSIPATIFLTTNAIDSERVLWHDRVFSAFRETRVSLLEEFGDPLIRHPLRTLEEKLYAQQDVLKFLWSLSDHERLFWIDRLMERLRVLDQKSVPDLMLTWDEVRIMYQNGLSFGSHTVTHPILSRLSMDNIRSEIYESKKSMEVNLQTSIKTFAYPNGKQDNYNTITKQIVKEAGYICALTTIFGANQDDQDLFELRRATPWDEDIAAFGARFHYYKFHS
jgi:peptidoglycan/xylan/chitin deacetylase (PgdA/CDA1 family)